MAGLDINQSIGPGGITLIVLGLIQLGGIVSGRNAAKQVQKKVGNGWTERLGETLASIKASADRAELQATEAKRVAAGANEAVRKTRGIAEDTRTEVNSKLDKLTGQFEQHITQHEWTGSNRRSNETRDVKERD